MSCFFLLVLHHSSDLYLSGTNVCEERKLLPRGNKACLTENSVIMHRSSSLHTILYISSRGHTVFDSVNGHEAKSCGKWGQTEHHT